jgi:hypothetical protein
MRPIRAGRVLFGDDFIPAVQGLPGKGVSTSRWLQSCDLRQPLLFFDFEKPDGLFLS